LYQNREPGRSAGRRSDSVAVLVDHSFLPTRRRLAAKAPPICAASCIKIQSGTPGELR
jgi:hypothetical protein